MTQGTILSGLILFSVKAQCLISFLLTAFTHEQGSVLASDAFFPFSWGDSVEIACQAGVKAIVHPGGSLKDQVWGRIWYGGESLNSTPCSGKGKGGSYQGEKGEHVFAYGRVILYILPGVC